MNPQELAGRGIHRDGGAARAGRQVEPAVDHQRAGLEIEVGPRPEVVGLEPPGDLERVEVGRVDLIERRVARGAEIAGPRPPFSVLRARLRRQRRRESGDDQHRGPEGPHYGCPVTVCCFFARRAASSSLYWPSVRNAMSVQPWPISSIVRLPQPIHAVGSGLCLLADVLSWYEMVWRIVPAGKRCG